MNKRNFLFTVLSVIMCVLLVFTVAACDDKPNPTPTDYDYTITFETNGGSAVASIGFNKGDGSVTAPSAPTKAGAEFSGWYEDSQFEKEFSFSSLEEKNYTVYARWKVTITFNVNGGTEINPLKKNAGDMIILPSAESDDGRVFFGWHTDEQCTARVDGLYTVPNGSVTLYAKWAVVEAGTTIDFLSGLTVNEEGHYTLTDAQGGGKTITPTSQKSTWSYVYSPVVASLSGYSVIHVCYQGTEGQSMIVKLEGGGAVAIEQKLVFTGEPQEDYWLISEENIATSSGQKLIIFVDGGVAGNEAETSVTVTKLEFCKMVGENDEEEHAIIFNSMGGTSVPQITGKLGSAITMPDDPTRAGYVFAGWYLDEQCNTAFTATTMPKGPTTVYAKWTDAPEHTVTFVTNCSVSADPIDVKEGVTITVPALKVDGWQFVGWYDDAELTVKSSLVMLKTNTTLYAKWKTLEDLSDKEAVTDVTTGWTATGTGYEVADKTVTVSADADGRIERTINAGELKYVNALHVDLTASKAGVLTVTYNGNVVRTVQLAQGANDEWIYLPKKIIGNKLEMTYSVDATLNLTKVELVESLEKLDGYSILKGWTSNQEGHYTVMETDGTAVITATSNKTAWSYVKIDLSARPEINLREAAKVNLILNGPAGHTVLLKFNNSQEYNINLDGTDQEVSVDISAKKLEGNNNLIIFIDGAVSKPADPVEVTFKLFDLYTRKVDADAVYVTVYNVPNTVEWESATAGRYTVTDEEGKVTVTATDAKTSWDAVRIDLSQIDADNLQSVRLVVNGTAGKSFLIKCSNATEAKVFTTGEDQTVVYSLTGFTSSAKYLQIILDPGQSGANMTLEIKSVVFGVQIATTNPTQEKVQDITEGWVRTIDENMTVTYDDNGLTASIDGAKAQWSKIALNADIVKYQTADVVAIRLTLTGTAGEKIRVRYNQDNAKQTDIVLTGEEQTVVIELSARLSPKTPLEIYIGPDTVWTADDNKSMTVTFKSIELCSTELATA